jgi:hypothetical protein
MEMLQVADYTRTTRVLIQSADGSDLDEDDARQHADAFIASRWPAEWFDFEYTQIDCNDAVAVVYSQ